MTKARKKVFHVSLNFLYIGATTHNTTFVRAHHVLTILHYHWRWRGAGTQMGKTAVLFFPPSCGQ